MDRYTRILGSVARENPYNYSLRFVYWLRKSRPKNRKIKKANTEETSIDVGLGPNETQEQEAKYVPC